MTLDDVSCLLHLPIEGTHVDPNDMLYMPDVVDLMLELLGMMWLKLRTMCETRIMLIHILVG